jgi:hypothetical protein
MLSAPQVNCRVTASRERYLVTLTGQQGGWD